VKASDDNDRLITSPFCFDEEKDAVRESSQQGAAHFLVLLRKLKWTLPNLTHHCVHGVQEFVAKSWPSALIPKSRFIDVLDGNRTKNERSHPSRLRKLADAASQETEGVPYLRMSSSRASNSSRCAAVRGIEAASCARLSQSCSMSPSRSSGESEEISMALILPVYGLI
jgi:hypothetical protein